jgi:3-oxoacyl-[acyl-carrier-protein] synthase-1
LFLNACGIVSPLGRGKRATVIALAGGSRDGFVARADLLPGRSISIGAVTGDLPPPPERAASLDCRNNRLMLVALSEIAAEVEAAAALYGRDRVAVVLGTSTSGIAEGEAALLQFRQTGVWPPSYHYRQQETGSLAEFAARALDLTGPAYTVATACSSSAKVFASARRLIRFGFADAAVVGGADTLCRMTVNGFDSLQALSQGLANPFSVNRDGINIGEGASAFLMTRAPGPVEFLGVGETSDAYHPTAPDPDGTGARLAMQQALDDAGLAPGEIDYVNLHGTATPLNDAMESKAIDGLFPASVPCSSTKGMTGHMLGGTGGCEAAFLWLTLNPATSPGFLPPHLWDGIPDPALPALDLIDNRRSMPDRRRLAMLSNSFGFGGSNVSLVLGRGWA